VQSLAIFWTDSKNSPLCTVKSQKSDFWICARLYSILLECKRSYDIFIYMDRAIENAKGPSSKNFFFALAKKRSKSRKTLKIFKHKVCEAIVKRGHLNSRYIQSANFLTWDFRRFAAKMPTSKCLSDLSRFIMSRISIDSSAPKLPHIQRSLLISVVVIFKVQNTKFFGAAQGKDEIARNFPTIHS